MKLLTFFKLLNQPFSITLSFQYNMRLLLYSIYVITLLLKISNASELEKVELDSNAEGPLLIEETLANSNAEVIDISNVKDIQFVDRNKNCYSQTSDLLHQFLNSVGQPVEKENIESISKYAYHQSAGIPKIYFEMVLNLNCLVDKRLEGIKFVKNFESKKETIPFDGFLTQKFLKVENIKTANLTMKFKNLYSLQKSKMEIFVVVELNGNALSEKLNKSDSNATSGFREILASIPNQYLFQRNLLKKEPFKFAKFSASSINLGLLLALSSCCLCGISFILKKRSLLKLDDGKSYYQDKGWWFAHSLMVIGDILHFVAFFFAPAVLVCVLQLIMVIVVAIASSYILSEKINTYWKLAFAVSFFGSLVTIVHVPKESHIYSINAFLYMVMAPAFFIYMLIIFLVTIIMISNCIPKYHKVNSLAYTIQSSIFGSIIVFGLKGILLAFTDSFFHWLPWTCLMIVGVCLLLQLDYLNRALTMYNTLVVTTQYYVLYSAFVILSSSLLYDVWRISSDETLIVIFCGFVTSTMGVLIFAIFQEEDATFDFSKLFAGPDIFNGRKRKQICAPVRRK